MRRSTAQVVAPLGALVAGVLFWLLSHGGTSSSMALRGYVEQVDHPVAPMAAGRVAKILVHVGQEVRPGDVLATLETRELELAKRAAELGLAQSKAELDAEEIMIGEALARAELLVLKTQSQQQSQRAQLAEVKEQLTRLGQLADERLVQAQVVESGKLRAAGLDASLQVLDAGTKQRTAGLGRALSGSATRQQLERRLEPYRQIVQLKQTALEQATLALEEATVRTKVAGIVSLILHQPGDVVAPASELVRVAAGRPGYVVCWLPERFATRLRVGDSAKLNGDGLFEPSFGGHVVELAPELEEVPIRARTSPNVPGWGRRAILETRPRRALVLGEAFHVRF